MVGTCVEMHQSVKRTINFAKNLARVTPHLTPRSQTTLKYLAAGAVFIGAVLARVYGVTVTRPLLTYILLALSLSSLWLISRIGKPLGTGLTFLIVFLAPFGGILTGELLVRNGIEPGNPGQVGYASLEERSIQRALQNSDSVFIKHTWESRAVESYYGVEYRLNILSFERSLSNRLSGAGAGRLALIDGNLLLAQGDGSLIRIEPKRDVIVIQSVPSNLEEILHERILSAEKFSIKGITVAGNKIFLSANYADEAGCMSTKIYSAPIGQLETRLEFHEFWGPSECYMGPEAEPLQSGGALLGISMGGKEFLVASHGDYRNRMRAQQTDSVFGSIILFDLSLGNEPSIVAKGLRNVQSICVLDSKKLILTEQGPRGGDEINVLPLNSDDLVNFGWPISSYGTNYADSQPPGSPSWDNHQRFGFIEPVYFWNPSIAPSSCERSIWDNDEFLIGALGYLPDEGAQSIHFMRQNPSIEEIFDITDSLTLGVRVRDIKASANSIWVLDDDGNLIEIKRE